MATSQKNPTINWRTAGNYNWAYQHNAYRLMKELKDFNHIFDEERESDIALYFDVLIHQQTGHLGKINILRIGGPKPLHILYKNNLEKFKKGLEQFDAIIALSPELYAAAKQVNKMTYLVPNGLDLTTWSYSNREKDRKNFVVGFAGSIGTKEKRKLKGFDYVEQACQLIQADFKYATKGKGQIAHNQMIEQFYQKIDCLVHPVNKGKEGSSNVIMEALALGIPVITTRYAGYHAAYLEHERNVLFCRREAQDIARNILRLKNDPALYQKLSLKGRSFCEKHHDLKKIASSYEQILTTCLRRHK